MARLSQNTLRTVRFYEEAGLLEPRQRTGGGHRLFHLRELKKLLLVSDLRAAGFTLEEIREMLLVKRRSRSGSKAALDMVARLNEHVSLMNARVALLRRLAAELDSAKDHLENCVRCDDASGRFPNACGQCGTLQKGGPLPDALGVLWGIDT
jgi:DNA-binding transcriptional MerR regulator